MLENVEEFKTWGPLKKDEKGRMFPDPKKKCQTYQRFIKELKKLGYEVDTRELRACDYGAPTIRKRFFMIARCDGQKIKWPEPTHAHPDSLEVQCGLLKPWKAAGDIIDWSIECPSIFTRKRPLAENTLKRIAKGFQKFVIDNPTPYIVRIGQTGFGGDKLTYPLEKPLTTVTTKAEHLLVTPYLVRYNTETSETAVRGQTLDDPLSTLDTSNRLGLVTAFIKRDFKSGIGHDLKEPLATVMTVPKSSLVTAFLVKYYGSDIGQKITDPLHTITTKDRFGLVTIKGEDYRVVDIGMRMLQPRELYDGQGFPHNYIIDHDYTGKKYPKGEQVKRCGNAVCPPLPEALVRANLPELCVERIA